MRLLLIQMLVKMLPENSFYICYNVCGNKCCKSTPPALTSEDIRKITTKYLLDDVIEKISKGDRHSAYVIKKKEGTNDCIFLLSDGRCKIYPQRPLDCKLFPILFKIKKLDEGKYLIKWYIWYCPLSNKIPTEKMLDYARTIVRSYLPKNENILFEYQEAMYSSNGYKKKHYLNEEVLLL